MARTPDGRPSARTEFTHRWTARLARAGLRGGPALESRSVGNALLVHPRGFVDNRALGFTQRLAADPQHTLVVLDLPARPEDAVWDTVARTLDHHGRSFRLVPGRGSRQDVKHAAQWLADRLDRIVLAPDGSVLPAAGGALFVPAQNGGGWLRYRPHMASVPDSRRFPKPQWEFSVPDAPRPTGAGGMVEPLPGGVWIRGTWEEAAVAAHRRRLVDLMVGHREQLAVALGSPGTSALALDEVAAFWRDLPPNAHAMARFVPYGPVAVPDGAPLGQALADLLGRRVAVAAGLPVAAEDGSGGVDVSTVQADGSLGWRPYAREFGYTPRAETGGRPVPPVALGARVPVEGAPSLGPGVYQYAHDVVLEVVQSGLWVRGRREPGDGQAVRSAPANTLFPLIHYDETEPVAADRMRSVAYDLLHTLDPSFGRRSRISPSGEAGRLSGAGGPPQVRGGAPGSARGQLTSGAAASEAQGAGIYDRTWTDAPPEPQAGPRPAGSGSPPGSGHAPALGSGPGLDPGPASSGPSGLFGASLDPARGPVSGPGPALSGRGPDAGPGAVPTAGPVLSGPGRDAGPQGPWVPPQSAGPLGQPPFPWTEEPVHAAGAATGQRLAQPPAPGPRPPEPPAWQDPSGPAPAGQDPSGSRAPDGPSPAVPASAPAAPQGQGPAVPPAAPPGPTGPHGPVPDVPPGPAGPVPDVPPSAPRVPSAPVAPQGADAGMPAPAAQAPRIRLESSLTQPAPPPPTDAPSQPGPEPAGGGGAPEPAAPTAVPPAEPTPPVPETAPAAPPRAAGPVRVQPAPAPAAAVTPPAKGLSRERDWVRRSLSERYDTAAAFVGRVLSEAPGLHVGPRSSAGDALTDLAAVRLYLTGGTTAIDAAVRSGTPGPHVPLARCAAGGLRRLPSYRGAALLRAALGPHERAWYREGAIVTEYSFLTALTSVRRGLRGDTDVLVWSLTARRTALVAPEVPDRVLFTPGTRFKVLRRVDGECPAVLLREMSPSEPRTPGEGGSAAGELVPLDEIAVSGLEQFHSLWAKAEQDPEDGQAGDPLPEEYADVFCAAPGLLSLYDAPGGRPQPDAPTDTPSHPTETLPQKGAKP